MTWSAERPTTSSSSSTRSRISAARSRRRWIWNGSPTICPTRLRGLSDAYGSWKIICISRRNGRSSRRDSDVMSAPSKRIVPLVGSCSRTSSRPSVDLPQPDSPTIAERLAAPHLERDAVDRVDDLATLARNGGRPHREVLDEVDRLEEHRGGPLRRAHAPARRRASGRSAAPPGRDGRRRGGPAPTRSSSSGRVEQSSKRCGQRGAKRQPRRRRERRRRRARDRRQPADARPVDARDRAEQAPRVRVLRVAEDRRLRPLLDDAARRT